MSIKQRLSYVFKIIIIAFSIVAVVIGVLLLYMSTDYRRVLNNYAYPQGDIATIKEDASEVRSATRGIVGYNSNDLISSMNDQ